MSLFSIHLVSLVHEMAHAWHTMLDLDNPAIISNYQRVNSTGIYENVPYINGVIAPKTYGLQVMLSYTRHFLKNFPTFHFLALLTIWLPR